eukprot:GEMP01060689.1.p1 GENE.GEMP01060689.1~~GEMP01060689.1.p1  ORF type:complete len:171 (+),score=30.27 GEMP01060689.1:367-879(+)
MQHLKVLISGLWADLIIAAVCGPLHFLATDWTQLRFRVTAVKPTGAEQTTTASSGPVNWKSNLYWALYYYSVVNLCFVPWMIFDTDVMFSDAMNRLLTYCPIVMGFQLAFHMILMQDLGFQHYGNGMQWSLLILIPIIGLGARPLCNLDNALKPIVEEYVQEGDKKYESA